jgi:hypothetical protein
MIRRCTRSASGRTTCSDPVRVWREDARLHACTTPSARAYPPTRAVDLVSARARHRHGAVTTSIRTFPSRVRVLISERIRSDRSAQIPVGTSGYRTNSLGGPQNSRALQPFTTQALLRTSGTFWFRLWDTIAGWWTTPTRTSGAWGNGDALGDTLGANTERQPSRRRSSRASRRRSRRSRSGPPLYDAPIRSTSRRPRYRLVTSSGAAG